MNSLFQIEIPKRNVICSGKGERLLPGMEYYSLLLEDEEQKIIRRDFCMLCWTQEASKEDFPSSRGHWKSKVEIKKEVDSGSRIDRAMALLKTLMQNQKDHADELFFLAMFLSHARRLVLRQEIEHEGEKFGLYEIMRQDEFVTIKIIPLTHVEIEKVQTTLAAKLK